jgi:hypothetical protein
VAISRFRDPRRLENGSEILLPERCHFNLSEWLPGPFVATSPFRDFRRLENGPEILLPERCHFNVSEWPPEPLVTSGPQKVRKRSRVSFTRKVSFQCVRIAPGAVCCQFPISGRDRNVRIECWIDKLSCIWMEEKGLH